MKKRYHQRTKSNIWYTKQTEDSVTSPFTCAICYDSFTKEGDKIPLLLLCGHSYCLSCMSILLLFSEKKKIIKCPLCQQASRIVSLDPLVCFKKNYALMESMEFFTSTSKPVGHLCKKHNMPLELLCLDDVMPICFHCKAIGEHENHQCQLLNTALEESKSDLKRLTELSIPFKGELSTQLQSLTQCEIAVRKYSSEARTLFQREMDKIDRAFQQELDSKITDVLEVIKSQKSAVKRSLLDITEVMEEAEKVAGSKEDIISFLKKKKQIEEMANKITEYADEFATQRLNEEDVNDFLKENKWFNKVKELGTITSLL
eukprot:TRINITY_DN5764_c0_g1_i1.p1 TRINITY_DN5764_c0_g1~~TRINITY_DN5764_c0_g1_i1.p1  ORF type:complete len:316 (+),score=30.37 TRINITY_DN5764_c0_g1_i1:77-1024(+)